MTEIDKPRNAGKTEQPVAVVIGGLGGGMSVLRIMAAAAAAAGCNIEFSGPGPVSLREQGPRGRSGQLLLPLQLRGRVEHTYTPKPLTKRKKRRLRGKEKQA